MADCLEHAKYLEGQGRFDEAFEEYSRLIEEGQATSQTLTSRALLHGQLGFFSLMTLYLEQAQAADIKNPYPWMWQGQYAKQMRRPHFSVACFAGAVRAAPTDYLDEMRINLAEAYLHLDRIDRAAAFAALVPADVDGWWAATRRNALDSLRQRRVAAGLLIRQRRIAPLDTGPCLDLARNLVALGRLTCADRLCSALMRHEPRDFAAFELRGRIIAFRDGLEAALTFLMSLEWLHADSDQWLLATARLLHDLGRFEEVIEFARRTDLEQDGGELLALVGFSYIGADHPERLGAYASRWMRTCDDLVPAAGMLVTAFLQKGDQSPDPSSPATPRGLPMIHFWNTPEIPDDVSGVIASWARHNGEITSSVFDASSAGAFIAEHHGSHAHEAFGLCHHPAMQADLFRIAFLTTMGGLYADADEECLAPLGNLLARAAAATEIAAVRSGEVPDFIHNFFLGCRAGSTTLSTALALQVRDIHKCRHEQRAVNIWHHTGPGLITRATGITLAERLDIATQADFLFIPPRQYRTLVQNAGGLMYKKDPTNNWHLS